MIIEPIRRVKPGVFNIRAGERMVLRRGTKALLVKLLLNEVRH